jgi:NTP pyrophosphatase (non-canonical NTP hydrolase)
MVDYAIGLSEEVGEVCGILKRLKRLKTAKKAVHKKKSEQELMMELGKEIADVQCYLALLATRAGFCLETEVINKFNEVSERVNSKIKL